MTTSEHIASLRQKAEACRIDALAFVSSAHREMMLRVAAVYDAIADKYETLTGVRQ